MRWLANDIDQLLVALRKWKMGKVVLEFFSKLFKMYRFAVCASQKQDLIKTRHLIADIKDELRGLIASPRSRYEKVHSNIKLVN